MIEFAYAFLAGILVKLVDLAEDHGLKFNKDLKVIFGAMYGLLIAYIISVINILPGFWFGIIIGLIISGKIDAEGHYAGVGVLLASLAIFGFPLMNPVIVLITSLICVLEEWINDELVDKKRVKGWLKKFLSVRPLLEIASVIFALYYYNISIFLLLFSFDAGYLIINKLLG
jgi:hypothetical protein